MQIACKHCNKIFNLPDEKLPVQGKVRFNCPNCGQKNVLDSAELRKGREQGLDEADQAQEESILESEVEPEIFPPGARVAFLFFKDSEWLKKAKEHLQAKGFYISDSQIAPEALQKLRLNSYNLAVVQDVDESSRLLEEIELWPGNRRRELNLILVGDRGQSFDPRISFYLGVNSYINLGDIQKTGDLFDQALQEYDEYQSVWEMGRKVGD